MSQRVKQEGFWVVGGGWQRRRPPSGGLEAVRRTPPPPPPAPSRRQIVLLRGPPRVIHQGEAPELCPVVAEQSTQVRAKNDIYAFCLPATIFF